MILIFAFQSVLYFSLINCGGDQDLLKEIGNDVQEPPVTFSLLDINNPISDGAGSFPGDPLSPNYESQPFHFDPPVAGRTDPDVGLNTREYITSRGFQPEEHTVITNDGYILQIYRIVNQRLKSRLSKPPVVLCHELVSSSSVWLYGSPGGHINDPLLPINGNLGFALAQRGFDVWLLNFRGSYYSTRHVTLDPHKDPEFWDFSFDELSLLDLPASINYIRRLTKSKTVQYAGSSQGTLTMFALLTMRREFNHIVKPFIAMAPVTYVNYSTSLAAKVAGLTAGIEGYNRGPGFRDSLLRSVLSKLCRDGYGLACYGGYYAVAGGISSGQFNETRLHVYAADASLQSSSKVFGQGGQWVNSGTYRMYDYGMKGNVAKYGSSNPPNYDLTRITNPFIALFAGGDDLIGDPKDVNTLRKLLKVKLIHDETIPTWGHLDFVFGIDVGPRVYSKVINLFRKYR